MEKCHDKSHMIRDIEERKYDQSLTNDICLNGISIFSIFIHTKSMIFLAIGCWMQCYLRVIANFPMLESFLAFIWEQIRNKIASNEQLCNIWINLPSSYYYYHKWNKINKSSSECETRNCWCNGEFLLLMFLRVSRTHALGRVSWEIVADRKKSFRTFK